MPKTFEEWTVLPHGKLSKVDTNMLTVVGEMPMPLGDFPRRMTVVRLADGRLVIYSAIALHEDEMAALEAFGTPAFLIVPNDIHRQDAKIWKDRYPTISVITPAGVRDKVEEVVRVDATSVEFGDATVRVVTVPGTNDREAALEVHTPTGTTLVVNDLIWNVDNLPGFGGWVFKALGFTGKEPKIPGIVEMREIKDKSALRAQLETWACIPDLERIVVSHGAIIHRDAPASLVRLAQTLN